MNGITMSGIIGFLLAAFILSVKLDMKGIILCLKNMTV